jgi:hypothetical protein
MNIFLIVGALLIGMLSAKMVATLTPADIERLEASLAKNNRQKAENAEKNH